LGTRLHPFCEVSRSTAKGLAYWGPGPLPQGATFPDAVSNAEWWTNAHASLAEILKLLDAARETAPKMPCRGHER